MWQVQAEDIRGTNPPAKRCDTDPKQLWHKATVWAAELCATLDLHSRQ